MLRFIRPLLVAPLALMLLSCSPDAQNKSVQTVVLYTSADDTFAKLVAEQFTKDTGIQVAIVGDTEATKTTGLVARLKAEALNPQADVWWSSEPFGTLDLTSTNALLPEAMSKLTPDGWPAELIADDGSWVGFASRARVIAYATDRVPTPPTTLRDFAQPMWKDRIGMARPQFGTTRGHMGIIVNQWGLAEFERWLEMLANNNIRLYDGNASVVRAIAMGEIDVGLTDTDDVWSGQRNGWKVDCVYDAFDPPMNLDTLGSRGPVLLPNTVGIVSGAPHPELAQQLAAYLISPAVESLLAMSESRNIPANPELADLFSLYAPPSLTAGDPNRVQSQSIYPNFSDAASAISSALDACDVHLP
tara:strand:- start:119368 stop:120447 length:1080 start_codon:yes stop_codon:yes gene_type:complete